MDKLVTLGNFDLEKNLSETDFSCLKNYLETDVLIPIEKNWKEEKTLIIKSAEDFFHFCEEKNERTIWKKGWPVEVKADKEALTDLFEKIQNNIDNFDTCFLNAYLPSDMIKEYGLYKNIRCMYKIEKKIQEKHPEITTGIFCWLHDKGKHLGLQLNQEKFSLLLKPVMHM